MCGIAVIIGPRAGHSLMARLVDVQHHRGPDDRGIWVGDGMALGSNRLAIIDLSPRGHMPMTSHDGRFTAVFNGEVYNHVELREELDYPFNSRSDTEVVIASYAARGRRCMDDFVGMFAFAIWDEKERTLFAARDRFGVKPLYYRECADGSLILTSEIKAIQTADPSTLAPDEQTWASYLVHGLTDHGEATFWCGVRAVPSGGWIEWKNGRVTIGRWYDLVERAGTKLDTRSEEEVVEEYENLLRESVALRFRSDVPVGVNLSGGLDSSILLALVDSIGGEAATVKAFTFVTGDPNYDETLWVREMVATTRHPLILCELGAEDVPQLAASVQAAEDEPFGGLPTVAYARLFDRARVEGVSVLLDGQGLDEQWAGYDYYEQLEGEARLVQGSSSSPVRAEALAADFRALAKPLSVPEPFGDDRIRNTQFRDICFTKIPRVLRFNDRISMLSSTELREPFLDHRLVELALRQPANRKIIGGTRKRLLRQIARKLVPRNISETPKRPLQTPQREWLHGPLRDWSNAQIEVALSGPAGAWFDAAAVRRLWQEYVTGASDNSFYVWQWISVGMLSSRFTSAVFLAERG